MSSKRCLRRTATGIIVGIPGEYASIEVVPGNADYATYDMALAGRLSAEVDLKEIMPAPAPVPVIFPAACPISGKRFKRQEIIGSKWEARFSFPITLAAIRIGTVVGYVNCASGYPHGWHYLTRIRVEATSGFDQLRCDGIITEQISLDGGPSYPIVVGREDACWADEIVEVFNE